MQELLVRQRPTIPFPMDMTVVDAMSELCVDPFTPKSVIKYKRKIARKFFYRNIPVYLTMAAWIVAALAGVMALFLAFANPIVQLAGKPLCPPLLILIPAAYALTVLLITAILSNSGVQPPTIKKPMWITNSYHPRQEYLAYEGAVPEFAWQTARSLKDRCGSRVSFETQSLYVDEVDIYDPFLVVVDNTTGNRYYVEVWGEPGFKK